MNEYFKGATPETGEIYLEDNFSKRLPLGIYARFSTVS
jgi:hypothetical protein